MKKKIIFICAIFVVVVLCCTNIFADVNVSLPSGNIGSNKISGLDNALGRTWATVVVIVQILSIGIVVFAGLRYMFASADKKADIKRRIDLVSRRSCYCFFCINTNKLCC